jgi:membrane-associated phospholipid phosphatase
MIGERGTAGSIVETAVDQRRLQRVRRLRKLFVWLAVLFLPVASLVVAGAHGSKAVAAGWMVATVVVWLTLGFQRCPRCAEITWLNDLLGGFSIILTRRCSMCGFHIGRWTGRDSN